MSSATHSADYTALQATRRKRHASRKRTNLIALTLSLAAMAFGLVWLIWILIETVRLGVISVKVASTRPPPM
ncbi:MAG: phosphate ABC transporter permease PtsA, partial [Rubrivivax sp.]